MKKTLLIFATIIFSFGIAQPQETCEEFGYNDGFIVGQARHDNNESGLSERRIATLARIHSESHVSYGEDRSAAEYQLGWKRGYADGFAGRARGGGEQAPLPSLPLTITREPHYAYKNIGIGNSSEPLVQLSRLAQEAW